MKSKGIQKYTGYVMIAVVVVFALLLFSYVHFSSTSTTQESFEEQKRTDTLYIDGSNNIINTATGMNIAPGFKAKYRGKYTSNGKKLGQHSIDVIFPPPPPPPDPPPSTQKNIKSKIK